MIEKVITIFCVCDEVAKCFDIKDDRQCKMCTSEIMTFAVLSALWYGCDYKKTRLISLNLKYFTHVLSHSQIVRRIHKTPNHVWFMIFYTLRLLLRRKDNSSFIIDSFPVKVYENHKSFRARIFTGKEYHGYTASKKQYFFGIKVHMIVDTDGIPIQFSFTPGSCSDINALKNMDLDLPVSSYLFGDKAYSNYNFEDSLRKVHGIKLTPKRRKNMKRQHSESVYEMLCIERNYIETVFSSIISRMPRYIKARTENGFCLKIMFFILAYMINLFS